MGIVAQSRMRGHWVEPGNSGTNEHQTPNTDPTNAAFGTIIYTPKRIPRLNKGLTHYPGKLLHPRRAYHAAGKLYQNDVFDTSRALHAVLFG